MTLAGCTRRLSLFDRVGVVIVAILGTCIGFLAFLATDVTHPIGATLTSFFGALCAILLYAWDRLANALARELPKLFLRFGRAMRAAR
jgi:hypothetical protein